MWLLKYTMIMYVCKKKQSKLISYYKDIKTKFIKHPKYKINTKPYTIYPEFRGIRFYIKIK